MPDWPHAPVHRFARSGLYFVTASTYLRRHYYRRSVDLDQLMSLLFALSKEHGLALQVWSIFSNHYHIVVEGSGPSVRTMLSQLHSLSARRIYASDSEAGRKVWFQFRDTQLTHERSWLARLRYTHQNPVKHGLVLDAGAYPWCSSSWFERTSSPAFVRTVASFKTDTVRVNDDFEVVGVSRE